MQQQQQDKPLSKRQLRLLEKQKNQPKVPFEEYKKQVQAMPNMNPFKYMEKIYKIHGNVDTDFSECWDFSDPKFDYAKHKIKKEMFQGLEVYELDFPQGVYIIKNCTTIQDQLDIAKSCMNTYIHEPYRTNLFIYDDKTKNWKGDSDPYANKEEEQKQEEQKEQQQQQQQQQDYNKDNFIVNDFSKFNFDTKIRWANVGSQYDWDNRQYPQIQTPIPEQIVKLQNICVELFKEKIPDVGKYKAESVIINYYHKKSYMTGHLDDGEEEQRLPIFSFSFGQSCVFLMGDREKDFQPIPIILEAGDLMVMSGYSRNCYHGVPRIIENSFKTEKYMEYIKEKYPELLENRESKAGQKDFENDYVHVVNFLSQTRINFNFRQVLTSKEE